MHFLVTSVLDDVHPSGDVKCCCSARFSLTHSASEDFEAEEGAWPCLSLRRHSVRSCETPSFPPTQLSPASGAADDERTTPSSPTTPETRGRAALTARIAALEQMVVAQSLPPSLAIEQMSKLPREVVDAQGQERALEAPPQEARSVRDFQSLAICPVEQLRGQENQQDSEQKS